MSQTSEQERKQDTSLVRALELCVGAGGLALGNARSGMDGLTTVVDFHPHACETLRKNKLAKVTHVRDWEIVQEDISEMDFQPYRGLDLISGGPPCQPWSMGGKRAGRHDEREMFPHFIRAIRECKPKAFIIENVKGLRNRTFETYFNYIIHQLRFPDVQRKKREKWKEHRARLEKLYTGGGTEAHYKVIWQVLNAANYGVGQRRERVFIVGVREDLGIKYSFPLATHSRESLLIDQWVTKEYWDRHRIASSRIPEIPDTILRMLPKLKRDTHGLPWRTVRDTIHDLPKIAVGETSNKALNHFLNPGARAYKGHDGSALDAPAKTIKAGYNGVPGGENMVRLDDGSIRYFSVRECARLQAFPDEWEFFGSWCACMRQIGNAVPVSLAAAVAKSLVKALRSKD